jgi:hypothetical protein
MALSKGADWTVITSPRAVSRPTAADTNDCTAAMSALGSRLSSRATATVSRSMRPGVPRSTVSVLSMALLVVVSLRS